MEEASYQYLKSRPRSAGAPIALRAIATELARQVPAGQMRSLLYLAGRGLAIEHPIQDARTLADFEGFAGRVFNQLDLGWFRVEEESGAVDFVHGCAPMLQWFGATAAEWSPGLLEGMYAEWMRQLGAGDRLDVRELSPADPGGEVLRFRLAHESSFGER